MSHDIQVIALHSVAVDLLSKGHVLDAGCRGFEFSKWFAERGHSVWAVDPSPDISSAPIGIGFSNTAIVGSQWEPNAQLDIAGDPEGWFIGRKISVTSVKVFTQTIEKLTSDMLWGKPWDLIKLNIEGSEYDVLETWPGPIAKQIVVSFHEHTDRRRGRGECDRLIDKMREWYTPVQHVWDARYHAGFNYWDTLLIRKDLA